jgi:hypothetical protein
MPLMKNVANQAIAFAYMQVRAVPGHNAGSVLTAMLQDRQRIID